MIFKVPQICRLLEFNPMSKWFSLLVTSHTLECLVYDIYSYSYVTVPPKLVWRDVVSISFFIHKRLFLGYWLCIVFSSTGGVMCLSLELLCLVVLDLPNCWAVVLVEIPKFQYDFQTWILKSEIPSVVVIGRAYLSRWWHKFLCGQERGGRKTGDIFMFILSL